MTSADPTRAACADAAVLAAALGRLEARYDLDRWHWRPGTPALDIAVGALLVQHTTWVNVEKALGALRAAGALDLDRLAALDEATLAALVRPAGTPSVKARRLKALVTAVTATGGFASLFARPLPEARALLLDVPGVGPETADCILLYAGGHLVQVHDAYTERLCRRLNVGPPGRRYAAWQAWLQASLPADLNSYRRFHAAVVVHAQETCRARPRCAGCPLLDLCPTGQAASEDSGR